MRSTILPSGMLLVLASAVMAQTELFFAAGVDSTGWAQAQSNADGQVLIESPEYPRGLWLHLVDEAGDALAGIQVEYQGRPDSLVAMRCVDSAGDVQETLVWTRPDDIPLRLTLRPGEATDLPAGLAAMDWQIAPVAASLLKPTDETRLTGWEAVAAFLRERWQGRSGRATVQFEAEVLAVELDHPEAIDHLVTYLQQLQATMGDRRESTALVVQTGRPSAGPFGPWENVIFQVALFADANLERVIREELGRPQGRLTPGDIASLTQIWARRESIVSLVGLENCTALQSLWLSSNQIVDLTPLANLTNLKELSLGTNQGLVDIRPLANLTNLEELHLENNWRIADWGPLASLINLQVLSLNSTLADWGPLFNMSNLQTLWLGSNRLSDLKPLASFHSLRRLGLYSNRISDLKPLANLEDLEDLDLRNNQIAEVGPLADLTNLESLNLWRNQVAEVGPLASLTNLDRLVIGENQIRDVTPFLGLTGLSYLSLEDNQIEDLSPLVANNGLSRGDSVVLTGNPLSDQARNIQIPALRERGVDVRY